MSDNELRQLEFLAAESTKPLLEMDLPSNPLSAQKKLRKCCPPEFAAAIAVLRKVRQKAAQSGKFPPELASRVIATDVMYQQASSMRLGAYIARRLAKCTGSVTELCCGMGADAISLARAGVDVAGYDVSSAAVFACEYNARIAGAGDKCVFKVADVTTLDIPQSSIVHIDPDRRVTGRRGVSLDDCSPSGEFLESLIQRSAGGVMKLSPALSWRDLEHWDNVTLEYISEAGVCRQLAAWWGVCASACKRKATAVWGDCDDLRTESVGAQSYCYADIRDGGKFLVEPDAAVLAAGAVDSFAMEKGIWKRCGGLDWLFADKPTESSLCRNFEIIREVSGREGDIKKQLAKLDAGIVEVKPRGVKMDTDKMQKKLSGKGKTPLVVLWTRFDEKQIAFIAERLA